MIPLKDNIPSRTFPFVNYGLITLNVLVFLYQLQAPSYEAFVVEHGLVPARFFGDLRQGAIISAFVPVFTSMFMHGGLVHILSNMLFLHIFGDNVEDRLGHLRFLGFYLLAGVGAAMAQTFLSAGSGVPMVGASGAIAGVLGGYFLMFPHARVLTLIPFVFIYFTYLPAGLFLGIWIFLQILRGTADLGAADVGGGVAWWAHIGGFATGFLLVNLLRKR